MLYQTFFFDLALEKVIRDAGVNTDGIIFLKFTQPLAYSGNIDIMGRTTGVYFCLDGAGGDRPEIWDKTQYTQGKQ